MTTEIRITDPITGGQKGIKDERYDLLPFEALDEVARVYGHGAKKYEENNWRKGYAWRLSLGALFRHGSAIMRGEDVDPESGCLHAAHIVFHALALITFKLQGLGTDDRPIPKGRMTSYDEYIKRLDAAADKIVPSWEQPDPFK